MQETHQELLEKIEAIVGTDGAVAHPDFEIDGVRPQLLARPVSHEEVVACLRVCSELNAAVIPAGRMTYLDCGNPLNRADVVLSLEGMTRVVDYSPPDLTATVEAGLTLPEFNSLTQSERQWLPLDPPGWTSATLGAIAACNSSGSLRLGFGTPRDYVIGLKLAHIDGTESKSGGRVVKNVAGYDLNKLYVGSYGSLSIITELTFKLKPFPERSVTVMISARYRGALFQIARQVLASELQPASVFLAHHLYPESASGKSDDALLVRFSDSQAAVEHQAQTLTESIDAGHRVVRLSDSDAEAFWSRLADFDERAVRVRLSVPRSTTPAEFEKAFLAHPECVATADIGVGIIRLAFDSDEASAPAQIKHLRSNAEAARGTLVIEKAPAEVRRAVDAWGDVGPTAPLMRSIRQRFDPQSLLNPGKFVMGL